LGIIAILKDVLVQMGERAFRLPLAV